MFNDALTHSADAPALAHALAEAATTAGHAPSIHNTQPWHWRLSEHTLDLSVERSRLLDVADPSGRLATLSCGVALQHARISLAARGWETTVTRLPEPGDPDHLARVVVAGRTPIALPAVLHLRMIPARQTERGPVAEAPFDLRQLKAIAKSVEAEDTWLHVLHPDQVGELVETLDLALGAEAVASAWRAELDTWTGDTAPAVPTDRHGDLSVLHDAAGTAARFAMLYGRDDEPLYWLRAGEALAAGWLTATAHGVSVLPLSAPIAVSGARETMRIMIAGTGEPYLLLRLGMLAPAGAAQPHTRQPVEQIVDGPAV